MRSKSEKGRRKICSPNHHRLVNRHQTLPRTESKTRLGRVAVVDGADGAGLVVGAERRPQKTDTRRTSYHQELERDGLCGAYVRSNFTKAGCFTAKTVAEVAANQQSVSCRDGEFYVD